ncbi:MAG: GAF domain-containing protein [Thermodesulfovibrionales bacterium]|jgi:signal transduction histidine kinase
MTMPGADKRKEGHFLNAIAQASGALAAVTGLVAIFGWLTGNLLLASFGSPVPMALSTALLFILYGSAVFLRVRKPPGRIMYRIWMSIVSIGTFIAILLFFLSYLGIYLSIEHLGIPISGTAGGVPIGHISPLTAFCFILAGFSFLAALSSTPDSPGRAVAGFWLACLIMLTSFVLFLAYLLGTPLLYGGHFIPPALSTSLAFVALGIALLAFAILQIRSKSVTVEAVDKRAIKVLILVFLILAVGIISAGYFYYHSYEKKFRAEVERQLSAIAEMKVDELVDWRKERLGDAAVFYKNDNFSVRVRQYFKTPENAEAKTKLRTWIKQFQSAFEYDRIFLLDTRGVERMSVPDKPEPIAPHLLEHLSEIMRSRQVTFLDFHRDRPDQPIHLAILVPVLDGQEGGRVIGLLVFRIDPQKYLYPFINRWPMSGKTAETLIVRRDGNDALFLNEQKFQKNAALNLRIPLEKTEIPAVQAVLGHQGIVEGKDYRGSPVIASVRAVPDSPWFLVARMDISEVYTPLRERLWEIVILIGALLVCAGAGTGFVWRHQRARYYREKYEAAERIQKLNRTLAMLSDINQAIVRIRESQELFEQACRIAVEKGNFSLAWIGLLDDSTKELRVVASAGKSGVYLEKINISLMDDPKCYCPVDSALRKGEHVICNVIGQDEDLAPCQKIALDLGLHSSVSFPLKVSGSIRGTVNFYTDEPYFFDEEEIKMLDELAMDISFAMEFFEKETERKRMEEELKHNESRMIALLELNRMKNSTIQDITSFTLEEAIRLTESKIGYLAFLNEDETVMTMYAWSKTAMEECRISDKPIIYPVETTGLWGEAVRQRRPITTNDYRAPNPWKKSYPEGHVHITRHMNIPVFDGERIVLVAGVGNKPTDYNESDVNQLTLLMEGMWRIIQRQQAETKIKQLNAELEQRVIERTAQLEAANKELETFSYSVSHDLRAPIRHIAGFVELLTVNTARSLDEKSGRYLNIIADSTKHMGHLIDDILSFSRMGRAEMQQTLIKSDQLVKEAMNQLQPEMGGRNVAWDIRPLPEIYGDPSMLKLVWVNLISNALKYSRTQPHAKIEIGYNDDKDDHIFYIRDNGAGFDMMYVHKLFNIFQRLHRAEEFEGTGVGLANVRRIVQRHGGRTWAEGKVNEGATFYFSLPKAKKRLE